MADRRAGRADRCDVRGFRDRSHRPRGAHRSSHGVHAMKDPVIEAKAITKTLGRGAGEVQALRGIDLSLRRGELTLLMGPSGSGKTTLLLILGCMLAPSSGEVMVCGAPTSQADKEGLAKIRRDHIGFVFQSYHLFPTLSAVQNVQLALDIRNERRRKARERSRLALKMVGLEQKTNALPRLTATTGGRSCASSPPSRMSSKAPCWS